MTDTIDVMAVILETWQPRGRVRSSHRSAQCGQMFSSYAGANNGNERLFGTQADVYNVSVSWNTDVRTTEHTKGHQLHPDNTKHPWQFWWAQHRINAPSELWTPLIVSTLVSMDDNKSAPAYQPIHTY